LVDKNRVYIEDLASQWGTEVNGQRLLMRQLLHHNDRIRMGDSEFVFVQAQAQ
ncbi:MAG: FHA domain-containing protein, partial [Candidatus Omnitrophica bacterium]|nr:FHA domain-containing protein [Candidatus Omnitrophota bacterium]